MKLVRQAADNDLLRNSRQLASLLEDPPSDELLSKRVIVLHLQPASSASIYWDM